ncbi:bifunctional adenosylcobinamide kinase/adenosylcobinamide-phosphate guanylyltransferase [Paenibacillus sp. GCM10027626]|uniref:bifunctional adenosylcobinamide kinase/adenosylcobinamide-phosphate guanylyltransferase n=1 Tax=Paenibacillus sp. GCM10027626 TaxID=3273411 RepID=UPI0036254411
MAILITGGARSGKSDFAEQYAMQLTGKGIYIATSQIWDEEMKDRVALHRKARAASGYAWETLEEPYELAAALRSLQERGRQEGNYPSVLVDCLTLWLSNWLLRLEQEADGANQLAGVTDELVAAVAAYEGPLLLVTNEVGSGIVPAYPLGRKFRDAAGRLNRRLAAVCTEAYLVVAGIPLDLKKLAFQLEER